MRTFLMFSLLALFTAPAFAQSSWLSVFFPTGGFVQLDDDTVIVSGGAVTQREYGDFEMIFEIHAVPDSSRNSQFVLGLDCPSGAVYEESNRRFELTDTDMRPVFTIGVDACAAISEMTPAPEPEIWDQNRWNILRILVDNSTLLLELNGRCLVCQEVMVPARSRGTIRISYRGQTRAYIRNIAINSLR